MDISVRDLKNRLSEYLRLVHRGERLIITSHGHAVATVTRTAPNPNGLPEIAGVVWASRAPRLPRNAAALPEVKGSVADLIVAERGRAVS